jgi:hypothetical protein
MAMRFFTSILPMLLVVLPAAGDEATALPSLLARSTEDIKKYLPKDWETSPDVKHVKLSQDGTDISLWILRDRVERVSYYSGKWHPSRFDWGIADAELLLKAAAPRTEWRRERGGVRSRTFLISWVSKDGNTFAIYNDLASGERSMPFGLIRGSFPQGLTLFSKTYRDFMRSKSTGMSVFE